MWKFVEGVEEGEGELSVMTDSVDAEMTDAALGAPGGLSKSCKALKAIWSGGRLRTALPYVAIRFRDGPESLKAAMPNEGLLPVGLRKVD